MRGAEAADFAARLRCESSEREKVPLRGTFAVAAVVCAVRDIWCTAHVGYEVSGVRFGQRDGIGSLNLRPFERTPSSDV